VAFVGSAADALAVASFSAHEAWLGACRMLRQGNESRHRNSAVRFDSRGSTHGIQQPLGGLRKASSVGRHAEHALSTVASCLGVHVSGKRSLAQLDSIQPGPGFCLVYFRKRKAGMWIDCDQCVSQNGTATDR
jgi:hypothetical protein